MKEIRDDVSMVFEGPNYMLHCCEKIRAVLESEQLDLLYDLRPPTKMYIVFFNMEYLIRFLQLDYKFSKGFHSTVTK